MMEDKLSLQTLLRRHLSDWNSGWSMGAFGAIAEFHQDDGETAVIDSPDQLSRATERGGIRIDPSRLSEVLPLAYETLSPRIHRWSQALALCLPDEAAIANERVVLTELGEDTSAIRPVDSD